MQTSKEGASIRTKMSITRSATAGIQSSIVTFRTDLRFLLVACCTGVSLLCLGCSRPAAEPVKPVPKANAVPVVAPQAQVAPSDTPPPPPPSGDAASALPATVAAPSAPEGVATPPAGMSQVEHLNWALGLYHVAHIDSPPLKDFEPLIKAKLLAAAPQAPPGKKYVLDGPKWEVRLEAIK